MVVPQKALCSVKIKKIRLTFILMQLSEMHVAGKVNTMNGVTSKPSLTLTLKTFDILIYCLHC